METVAVFQGTERGQFLLPADERLQCRQHPEDHPAIGRQSLCKTPPPPFPLRVVSLEQIVDDSLEGADDRTVGNIAPAGIELSIGEPAPGSENAFPLVHDQG